jgi:hypothetical protein
MKNFLKIFILTLVVSATAQAQTEIKINPVGLLFKNVDLGVEFGVSKDIGIELRPFFNFGSFTVNDIKYKNSRIGAIVEGKYYFNTEKNIDKFYADIYMKYVGGKSAVSDNTSGVDVSYKRFAVGFGLGYKWVTSRNIVIEIGLGVGRAFVNEWTTENGTTDFSGFPLVNIDGTGKLAVGYRF